MNGSQTNNNPTIPTTRKPTSVRPTRASLARANIIQAKRQQQQLNSTLPQRNSLTRSNSLNTLNNNTNSNNNKPNHIRSSIISANSQSSLSSSTSSPSTPSSTNRLIKSTNSVSNIRVKSKTTTTTTTNSTPAKRKSVTTKESLKKRPAWDMRGKISDLEAQLEKSNDKLKGLYQFRDELQVLKEDKESERKEAIQRAVTLKAELQQLEKDHLQEVENINSQQRIHYQELEDKQLIYKRRVTTIEIELEDANRRYKDAEKKSTNVMQEHQMLERFSGTLADRERDIAKQEKILAKEQPATESAERKLQEAESHRKKLQSVIKELE
ncbi:hypothetical protein BJ944DRAFT_164780 [Cunninghamella echinulata]|nr:hypothetical protein BJ944DRAFT_164780 [Cunninghamella echinulata]